MIQSTTDSDMTVGVPVTATTDQTIPYVSDGTTLGGLHELNKKNKVQNDLTRKDFKVKLIKGISKHYYSFTSVTLELEICLEPCFNGFDVAFYENKYGDRGGGPALKEKKICTDIELPKGFFEKEILGPTQERSDEVWDKALKIVNNIWRKHRNTSKLKDWGMIEGRAQGMGTVSGPSATTSGPSYSSKYYTQANSPDSC